MFVRKLCVFDDIYCIPNLRVSFSGPMFFPENIIGDQFSKALMLIGQRTGEEGF